MKQKQKYETKNEDEQRIERVREEVAKLLLNIDISSIDENEARLWEDFTIVEVEEDSIKQKKLAEALLKLMRNEEGIKKDSLTHYMVKNLEDIISGKN